GPRFGSGAAPSGGTFRRLPGHQRREVLRMKRLLMACAMIAGAAGSAAAQPMQGDLVNCNTRLVRYFLAENAVRETEQSLQQPGCNYAFPGDAYTIYEQINVVRRPQNLVITPNSNGFGFSVRIRGNYRGPDVYTIRACGRGREGPGCVTITYNVTVY
ncbi:MAG: hypothetical protein ACRCTI_12605, partial [Beijerinckiaceae bacterium]